MKSINTLEKETAGSQNLVFERPPLCDLEKKSHRLAKIKNDDDEMRFL